MRGPVTVRRTQNLANAAETLKGRRAQVGTSCYNPITVGAIGSRKR
jgi:hypothetical protein